MFRLFLSAMVASTVCMPASFAQDRQLQLKERVIEFIQQEEKALQVDIERFNELSHALAKAIKDNAGYSVIMNASIATAIAGAAASLFTGMGVAIEGKRVLLAFSIAGLFTVGAIVSSVSNGIQVSINEADMDVLRGQMKIAEDRIRNRMIALTELKKQIGVDARSYDFNSSGNGPAVLVPVK